MVNLSNNILLVYKKEKIQSICKICGSEDIQEQVIIKIVALKNYTKFPGNNSAEVFSSKIADCQAEHF